MRALLLATILVGGCAFLQPKPQPAEAPLGPGEVRSVRATVDSLVVGKSTKSDVRAALGDATVVDFPTGYDVWVYRERPKEKDAPTSELVLLFDPAGTLAKARVR